MIEKIVDREANLWKKAERERAGTGNTSTGNVYENIKEVFELRYATSDEYVLRYTYE